MIRFLVDECLTRHLVRVARDLGHEAEHVLNLDLGGQPDRVIATEAIRRGKVLVTNNARDFRRLYAHIASHPGLWVIQPSVVHTKQMELFAALISLSEPQATVANQLVTVRQDGSITIESWPKQSN